MLLDKRRWWEVRKIWESIVNDSRILILQLQSFGSPGNLAAITRIAYRHIAWCYALSETLRGLDPINNLEKYFSD